MYMQAPPIRDTVRALGYLALASRLKRVGELLHWQPQPLLDRLVAGIPAGRYPLLVALERGGPSGAVALAATPGVRQPEVARMLETLRASGLIRGARGASDRRARPVELTRAGRELPRRSREQLWPWREAAVSGACG